METNNDNSVDNEDIVVQENETWNNITPEPDEFYLWNTTYEAFEENLTNTFTAECMIEGIKDKNPYDIFSLIFTEQLFDKITYNTNLYFYQFSQNNKITESSEYARWKDINNNICKAFIGVLLLMGLNYRTNLNDHWSTDKLMKSIISEIIPRNKFWIIWGFFHLSDNTEQKVPMDKVKSYIDYMEQKWLLLYKPGQKLTIDETMMDYQGRARYKQYAPKKPTKWGIKAFCMADANNGYMLKFRPYEGKDKSNEKISEKIVKSLSQNMENRNYIFYVDSYFSSPYLFSYLKKNGYDAVGTLNLNRKGITNSIKKNDLDEGNNIKIYEKESLMLLKYKDKRSLSVLSTIKELSLVNTNVYDKKEKEIKNITKPTIILNYSKYMRGVDLNNQLCAYYKFDNRVHKWWKVVFMHGLHITITNSFIIYNTFGKKDMTHKEFLLSIIYSLLENHSFMDKTKIDLDLEKFFTAKKTQQVCKDCKKKKEKTSTKFFCIICDKAICKKCRFEHIFCHFNNK